METASPSRFKHPLTACLYLSSGRGWSYDSNLEQLKLDRQWLASQLELTGIHDFSEMF
ncbi:hypothetical protein [Paenibacillus sp. S150]|uniref:hypothetical protein n=1 Tax=Paenibacillus sp. S150 TaxID=2749826 RepID=UPI001C577219|nr:hypothetical protein [Paenibacillus sp. S150]MBW4082294.1 hypothetical protein [Paenibacillus sp. S150]